MNHVRNVPDRRGQLHSGNHVPQASEGPARRRAPCFHASNIGTAFSFRLAEIGEIFEKMPSQVRLGGRLAIGQPNGGMGWGGDHAVVGVFLFFFAKTRKEEEEKRRRNLGKMEGKSGWRWVG